MNKQLDRPCQWKHCDAQALVHVWFGLLVRDLAHSQASPASYTPADSDLCAKHAAAVGRRYVHVTEFELDQA
jgi:hypothetical protein